MKTILTICGLLVVVSLQAQEFSEKITREFTLEKKSDANTVHVANINGSVLVTGYDGDKIMLEVTKSIKAKTDARLEQGKQEIHLGVMDRADTLVLYVKDPCAVFGQRSKRKDYNGVYHGDWGYGWCKNSDEDCGCQEKQRYDYTMSFVIKVPASMHLVLSTVNNGDITVDKVKGEVDANNINGSIRLAHLQQSAQARTINGDVDIEYLSNPKKECKFYTLNGDINALFQKGLAANLSFESFNGNFYTNIDKIQALPVSVEKTAQGEGIKYKVSENRYKVGNGGALLDFETFNGNVYLKEIN